MDTVDRMIEINSRLEHLEHAAEWISRETVHTDNSVSQTSTLIQVLVDDIREKLFDLVKDFELITDISKEGVH